MKTFSLLFITMLYSCFAFGQFKFGDKSTLGQTWVADAETGKCVLTTSFNPDKDPSSFTMNVDTAIISLAKCQTNKGLQIEVRDTSGNKVYNGDFKCKSYRSYDNPVYVESAASLIEILNKYESNEAVGKTSGNTTSDTIPAHCIFKVGDGGTNGDGAFGAWPGQWKNVKYDFYYRFQGYRVSEDLTFDISTVYPGSDNLAGATASYSLYLKVGSFRDTIKNIYTTGDPKKTINLATVFGKDPSILSGTDVYIQLFTEGTGTEIAIDKFDPVIGIDNMVAKCEAAVWVSPAAGISGNQTFSNDTLPAVGVDGEFSMLLQTKGRAGSFSIVDDLQGDKTVKYVTFAETGAAKANDGNGNYTVDVPYTLTPSTFDGTKWSNAKILIEAPTAGPVDDDFMLYFSAIAPPADTVVNKFEFDCGTRIWYEFSFIGAKKEVVFVQTEKSQYDSVVIASIAGYMDSSIYNVSVITKNVITNDLVPQFDAADVVIMGRSISSGDIGTARAVWDSISAPVLSMNMWGLRGRTDKGAWTPNTESENVVSNADTVLQAEIIVNDSVFAGVSASTIDWWNGMFSIFGVDAEGDDAGNGMLLAKTSDNRPLFIRWAANEEFYPGAGHTPNGDRSFIGCGNDNTTLNYFGFSDVAKEVFFAELARMASGEATVIPLHTDANLSAITPSAGTLIPEFNADTLAYIVDLAPGTTEVPTVDATTKDRKATTNIIQASSLAGTARIIVSAEDATIKKSYTVKFNVLPKKEVIFVQTEKSQFDSVVIASIVGYADSSLYNVTVITKNVITADLVPQFDAADVVIMGRSISSGDIGTARAVWDSISAPVLSMNMWGLRGRTDKGAWTPVYDSENVTSNADTVLQADILVANDPVFAGVSTASMDWWNGMFSIFAVDNEFVGAGNGLLLAKTIDNRPLFIRWAANVEFYEGAGHTPNGDRSYIGCGNDNTELNYFGFTDGAKEVFFAELARMASGEATVIPAALSKDATLATLVTSAGTLDPVFDAATLTYSVELPTGTTALPTITTATAVDSKATVAIVDATALPGSATVTVTAEYSYVVKTYTVNFTVKPDGVNESEVTSLAVKPTVSATDFTVVADAGSVITVFDITGQLVSTVVASDNETVISVDATGVYFVKVGNEVVKIVKI